MTLRRLEQLSEALEMTLKTLVQGKRYDTSDYTSMIQEINVSKQPYDAWREVFLEDHHIEMNKLFTESKIMLETVKKKITRHESWWEKRKQVYDILQKLSQIPYFAVWEESMQATYRKATAILLHRLGTLRFTKLHCLEEKQCLRKRGQAKKNCRKKCH